MDTLQIDTVTAVNFLRKWLPEGPWVLTAIVPDGLTETVTFPCQDWHLVTRWVDDRQGKKNIYFQVNPARRALSSKSSKEDIARMSWLHIDIDPRAGEDIEQERKRALSMLKKYKPAPTVIIDSGGGYQGFWRLQDSPKLEINGSVEKAKELEAYNVQLEKEFNADHCHNVDRIMRLPGTVNIPNKKKVRKGRVPVVSALIEFTDRDYPLSDFIPAVSIQDPSSSFASGTTRIAIGSNQPDVGVDDLAAWAQEHGAVIADHTMALIATGQDPIDPTKYESRSEALFRVCCDLVRAEVPNDMIYAVITGSNEIATSVKDKPNWENYAIRQIERAHEEAIDPVLRKLNEKHAVIEDVGGKCRIVSEVYDPSIKRARFSKQSFEDFRNRYRNIKVQVGRKENGTPILKAAGTFWIDHPNRRQYETLVFAPGQEVKDAYNLWRGFACDSLRGDGHQLYLKHIKDNLCSGNLEHYTYLIGWMARMVQKLDSPGEVAVVLRGARGTGKTFFADVLSDLLGRHAITVSDPKHLVGSFNSHLRDVVFLFGDEAFFAGDKKHESVLKTLVTGKHLVVEGKGVDAEDAPNFVHLLLASNGDWVVPAGLDERRFFVIESGTAQKQNHAYFKKIKNSLDTGGLENLLYFLLTYNISEFEVRNVPQTAALQEQKIMSMTPEQQWLFERVWEGSILSRGQGWTQEVMKNAVYADYIDDMKQQGRNFRMSKVTFGKFLNRSFPEGQLKASQVFRDVTTVDDNGYETVARTRVYVYRMPTLKEVREYWDDFQGGPYEWPAPGEDVEENKPKMIQQF